MAKIKDSLVLLTLLVMLTAGCTSRDGQDTTTTTVLEVSSTTTTIETTTTSTTTTTTTTTTSTPVIITTTTTTTTTITYIPTTTIADAKCYMNSDCGEQKVSYYCKIELEEGPVQPTVRGETVYKVTETPICLDPGTMWAKCTKVRKEREWDACKDYEYCLENCPECVLKGSSCCPGLC
ncbi:MAG: hypothetical protein JW778_07390 [Candidatus Altiarchaeota archaeon]|nr:hypothetical protein [Candidatus Altiarchaeota archaeon]